MSCNARGDLVSIIMGVYNAKDTLGEAIESIINQTYQNWELIICDDGSTDGSLTVANSYTDPRIVVIKNERNRGLGYSLNRCIEKANGMYIARMDADDISVPSRLEKEVFFLKNNLEYGVVSSIITTLNTNRKHSMGRVISEPKAEDFIIGSPVAHAPSMMRRECIDAAGGYSESKDTLRVEDIDLWIKLLLTGCRFYVLDEPLYSIRFNYNSVKRQKLKYRWNGAIVRLKGCKQLRLPAKYYLLSFRTVLIGLIPASIRYRLHIKQLER